ncbi:putative CRAL-TRIO lipid binding domain, GOLD domain, CRAL/TRIO domain, CRAL/TRIO domain superfamily [Helianthus annuus]|uniref:CRAL-TRIO lipid binding domain, GOLD domain, CRAL/TRIO domain, CRAL/TRIO domain superfamily n=1 Tax=Helianthus annuus TaxID=4232 RepID=A0A251UXK5_HELAN|nr:patellin-3 [Helianthus annuus]KAF5808748.1 putative CRAL-TRIO lipid binding domain, GOLD domain, CRAL/TRIO domain, CRAL/TRIO domain superfamily [Helianthus annuus]KAJ0756408.1 putative CRAL-TRIO lipid binding domain, GOLD domain, CRAL/TRIO domain, CRAL/TRIO domain superfamily [Helianthus annuus]KAJ0760171.1 putative CRAL-TRIO lipid binding domain, GOLD domain, CRAL/TRIO domain, CRAL/TRIO domain superfamily [Helianthus annuus]
MAEETLNTTAAAAESTAVTAEVAVAPEAEKVEEAAVVVCEKDGSPETEKISESTSFKEESNVAGELPDPEKKALDELRLMVQEALNKHEFSAPPAAASEEKPVKEEVPAKEEKATAVVEEEAKACAEAAGKDESTPSQATAVTPEVVPVTEVPEPEKTVSETETEVTEPEKNVTEPEKEVLEPEKEVPEPEKETTEPEKKVTEPETKEKTTEPAPAPAPAPEPEEVSIWGIPLLADERSDVVLLKFLRARDFKVKEAFTMLKNVVAWRKQFGIESLLSEDLGTEQEKVVYMHGVDKEGHPVCYNAYGEYQNKELYNETFSTEEKRTRFLRWRIQFLEKSIRKLDFSPNGMCTIVQVIDFKNSPGPFKWELRQATNQALQLFQDNYPEFVAKQVFINVPFLYLAFYKIINPFFTQRTKSKFVFAGPSKTAETLFKYIAPELVPVQYGGLSRECEFVSTDSVTEEIIKPSTKHTIEIPAPESCTLVWEARVVGNEMTYGAEFVPVSADSYTVIVQKSRKLAAATNEPVISGQFKCDEPGKVVLTFDNQTSKKKKVLYRSKTKVAEPIKC